MCHCIFLGINPRVSKHHAFRHYRVTLHRGVPAQGVHLPRGVPGRVVPAREMYLPGGVPGRGCTYLGVYLPWGCTW